MKYNLVLQWPSETLSDYDSMLWIEEQLIENLGEQADVDGHDIGSGSTNIFILTDAPELVFLEIKNVLGSLDFMIGLRAAYRKSDENDYTILWPKDLDFFSI
jgi:hypothetical protein